MNTLHLKQNVLVKVIVTEQFKEKYKKDLEKQLKEVEGKARSLKSSLAELVIQSAGVKDVGYVESLKTQIEQERMLQEALASELREKIKEADKLEIGSLFPYTVIEGNVEVKEGDNLWEKVTKGEIIVKDDIVVSIKWNVLLG